MIFVYCAWCAPPRLLRKLEDGKAEVLKTDTICPACAGLLLGETLKSVQCEEVRT